MMKLNAGAAEFRPSLATAAPVTAIPASAPAAPAPAAPAPAAPAPAAPAPAAVPAAVPAATTPATTDADAPLFVCSIDVECVATGMGNGDRAVARIALVDAASECVLFDRLVKPTLPIVSYLSALTGILPGMLDAAPSLAEARAELLQVLPRNAHIVGQAIQHDIDWLELEAGTHFHSSKDVGELFAVPGRNGRVRMFSLRHEVLHLRGFEGAGTDIQAGAHDPVLDALFAVRLFVRFSGAAEDALKLARDALCRAPPTPATWRMHPIIDGVRLGPEWAYKNGTELN